MGRQEYHEMTSLTHNQWPKQGQVQAFYGKPGTNHTSLVLPYPMRIAWDKGTHITKFTINVKCHDSALRVFNKIKDRYSMDKITELGLDLFGGCYNNRPMRGGTVLSMHAFACAIDFDPERNQLKWSRKQARLAKPDCNEFWEAWESEGWTSLGRARDFDWMHVQAANL